MNQLDFPLYLLIKFLNNFCILEVNISQNFMEHSFDFRSGASDVEEGKNLIGFLLKLVVKLEVVNLAIGLSDFFVILSIRDFIFSVVLKLFEPLLNLFKFVSISNDFSGEEVSLEQPIIICNETHGHQTLVTANWVVPFEDKFFSCYFYSILI